MKRAATLAVVAGMLLAAGCDLLGFNTVLVSLVNTSTFDVEATLYIDDEQDIPEFLLTEIGEEIEFTIPAGQTVTFARDCDELQAIVIDDADLLVIGGAGPETSTNVLRDGDEFRCGSQIIFTFSHSAAVFDFDVSVSVP